MPPFPLVAVAAAGAVTGLIGLAIYDSLKNTKKGINAVVGNPEKNLVPVVFKGETWLVSPTYAFPMGIGEGAELAKSLGFELPTPGLVDAIWRAADVKIIPPIRASDGTPKTMSTPAVFEAQGQRIEALLADKPFHLLAGTHKDIVRLSNGKTGIYGWHTDQPTAFIVDQNGRPAGIPLHAPETPGEGRIIQQPFGGHGLDWKDYSQGIRFVKKAGPNV